MKKILAILVSVMLVATAAYALDMLEEDALDDVSGQAGLTITNYSGSQTINLTLGGLSWGDSDGYSPLAAEGAGCLVIDALGTKNTLGVRIVQNQGNVITVDVDGGTSAGIYLSLGNTSITVSPPTYLRLGVIAGNSTTFGGVPTGSQLGDLGFQNLSVGVTTPSIMKISPH